MEEPRLSQVTWGRGGGGILHFFIFILVKFVYACTPKISFPCILEELKSLCGGWVDGLESEFSDRLSPRPIQTTKMFRIFSIYMK